MSWASSGDKKLEPGTMADLLSMGMVTMGEKFAEKNLRRNTRKEIREKVMWNNKATRTNEINQKHCIGDGQGQSK